MLHHKVTNRQSLGDDVKEKLIALISTQEFPSNKLPAESKLAKRFGVSVNVMREALLLLREDGIITKKHGSGNYFHRSALKASNRLDRTPDFGDLLTVNGFTVNQAPLDFTRVLPPEPAREILRLNEGEFTYYYASTIYADGNPAIYCDSWFPEKACRLNPVGQPVALDFFDFIIRYRKHELAYGQMEFVAQTATALEEAALGLPQGSPFIVMEESFYSLEDIPLVFSRNKFNRKYIRANTFLI